jgi:hypothetical protein
LIGKAYAATNTAVAVLHNGNREFTTILMHENVAQNMELLIKKNRIGLRTMLFLIPYLLPQFVGRRE